MYIDDILVTGATKQEHLNNLEKVLDHLEQAGIQLKREKCSLMLPKVKYFGHVIDKDGLTPSEAKTRAIVNAPAPRNVTELRSLLGLVNYYRKFLPSLSNRLAPLYKLLKKRVPFHWGKEQS